jgi:glycosyltransferase involved in cell wall biosynthesis
MPRKVIVCTITKNEEQFIQRWTDSAQEADYRVILDTGSTDGTVEKARNLGIVVHEQQFNPWRFDHARNHLLNLLPLEDAYVINLDADEVLVPGWRTALDQVQEFVTRPRYNYVWNWNADGTPGLTYSGDKIHHRNGFYWRHPVHEVITPTDGEFQLFVEGLEIHHFPDNTKPRSQYLPLLLMSVEETPDDDRNVYYCARELYFNGMLGESVEMFKRHLALPSARWEPERAWSMRYLAKMLPLERGRWLLRAVAEYPSRETWLDLAKLYLEQEDWASCYAAASKCLAITYKPLLYLNEAEPWGTLPAQVAAMSAFRLGLPAEAARLAAQAGGFDLMPEKLTPKTSSTSLEHYS